jgi:hypothetical protein
VKPGPIQEVNPPDLPTVELLRPIGHDHWLAILPKGVRLSQKTDKDGGFVWKVELEASPHGVEMAEGLEEFQVHAGEMAPEGQSTPMESTPMEGIDLEAADTGRAPSPGASSMIPVPSASPSPSHKRKSAQSTSLSQASSKKRRSSPSTAARASIAAPSADAVDDASTVNRGDESVISPRGTVPITGGRTSAQAKGATDGSATWEDEGSAGSQQKTPVGKTKGAQAENSQRRRTRASTQSKTASSQAAAESNTRAGRARARRN